MKILLTGAFGKLGSEILRALCKTNYEIIAAGSTIRVPEDIDPTRITTLRIDVTDPETLKGICKDVDTVITTVGLTGASAKYTNYDIDYKNKIINVGGTETYTYREIAEMFYAADGVTNGPVKTVPAFLMDILANLPKIKQSGRSDIIRFSKFTLTHDCYGDTEVPGKSFRKYIASRCYATQIEKEKGIQ